MLNFSRCRLPPFDHQREDVEWLMNRPFALIASEMRTGKTKIVIDAAQFLYEAGEIEQVVVVTPAPVRNVWADQTLGEIGKHAWLDLPNKVVEYHDRVRVWTTSEGKDYLTWYVTNFEFLRSKKRLEGLMPVAKHRTLLVLDESSFIKNHASQQTIACTQLRNKCGRVVELNGTPIFHSPLDLFSQGNILSPRVLECKHVTLFKARYALQAPVLGFGGKPMVKTVTKGKWSKDIIIKEITGWTNLEDLERRFAPYTVRRLQKDCLDLPPKLDPVTLTAVMTPETWRVYKEMRDELVVWLSKNLVAVSPTAAIRVLRLAQIAGGFISGIEDSGLDEDSLIDTEPVVKQVFIGREKLDILFWFIEQQLEVDPNLHVVAWTRFRAELFRMIAEVKKKFPQFEVASIHGGQKKDERLAALALLKPETSPLGPVFLGGIEGTGSFGLDMTAAHTCVTLSSGYSAGRSAQTLDRVYGPGQKFPVAYFNIVATGPKGQRTIDHDILTARLAGENIAQRTSAAWVKALMEE